MILLVLSSNYFYYEIVYISLEMNSTFSFAKCSFISSALYY